MNSKYNSFTFLCKLNIFFALSSNSNSIPNIISSVNPFTDKSIQSLIPFGYSSLFPIEPVVKIFTASLIPFNNVVFPLSFLPIIQ